MFKTKHIKYNYSNRNNKKIKYIVIHDTGNPRKAANAEAHFRYFNQKGRNASAHYFVDSHESLQLVADHHSAWHCGDGKGKYGITNSNSIGIEICINSDGNFENALINTYNLILHLIEKYNICNRNVLRHYDASRKICPGTMSLDNWGMWLDFHGKLYC